MIYFVTPAWQRFALTRVCLEQRRQTIDYLATLGIEARCVVVADDANADAAEDLGLDALRKPNYALGRRFNDGIEYAARHGADWIIPIGSDSFLDPAYLAPLPEPGVFRSSHLYAIAEPGRLGQLRVDSRSGVGPYLIPARSLPKTLRPASDYKRRGVDASTLRGLRKAPREYVDMHPYQYVGWRSAPQMNGYDKLYRRLGIAESRDVGPILDTIYPHRLVQAAIAACSVAREAVA